MWKYFIALLMALSATLSADIQVLAFSGSTREESTNKKLINEAAALASQMGANVTLIDLRDFPMPFYDGDVEETEGMPENAKKFRELVKQSDVILIASPNYNGSFSGVLKNVLDWASRSEEGDEARDVFQNKKFAIMSASPGKTGGVGGLTHLRTVLEKLRGKVIPQQVGIPYSSTAFDSYGKIISPEQQSELEALIRAVLAD